MAAPRNFSMPYNSTRSLSPKISQNRCVHRHGSSIKMAARTAAFEFSEKMNGRECEGVFVGQRLLGREICFATEKRKTKNGLCCSSGWQTVCVLYVSNGKERRSKGRSGGQRNDFRKQKLKGFSFVRISEKIFSRIAFSDNIWWTVVCF